MKKLFSHIKLSILILLPVIMLSGGASPIVAQSGTSNVDSYSAELEEQLMLEIPPVTENPSHAIVFTDPSGDGVSLIIDGQDRGEIESPYNLPTLGIGKHTLEFKFKDKEEVSQTLIKDIVIVPRQPRINTPSVINSKVSIDGTGVAGGVVEIFLSGGLVNYRKEAQIDINGDWTLSMEEELAPEKYTIVAIARKNGFASRYSEPVNFEIRSSQGSEEIDDDQVLLVEHDLESMSLGEIVDFIVQSRPLLISSAAMILIGVLLGVLLKIFFTDNSSKKVENLLRSSISAVGVNVPGKDNKKEHIKSSGKKKRSKEKKEDEICFAPEEVQSIKEKLENGLKEIQEGEDEFKEEKEKKSEEIEDEKLETTAGKEKGNVSEEEEAQEAQEDEENVTDSDEKIAEEIEELSLEKNEGKKLPKVTNASDEEKRSVSVLDKIKGFFKKDKKSMSSKVTPVVLPTQADEEDAGKTDKVEEAQDQADDAKEDMLDSFLDNLSIKEETPKKNKKSKSKSKKKK